MPKHKYSEQTKHKATKEKKKTKKKKKKDIKVSDAELDRLLENKEDESNERRRIVSIRRRTRSTFRESFVDNDDLSDVDRSDIRAKLSLCYWSSCEDLEVDSGTDDISLTGDQQVRDEEQVAPTKESAKKQERVKSKSRVHVENIMKRFDLDVENEPDTMILQLEQLSNLFESGEMSYKEFEKSCRAIFEDEEEVYD